MHFANPAGHRLAGEPDGRGRGHRAAGLGPRPHAAGRALRRAAAALPAQGGGASSGGAGGAGGAAGGGEAARAADADAQ